MNKQGQKGVAAVELAMVLPLFGLLLLGVLEIGGMARAHQILQNGAREGARFSAMPANRIGGGAPAPEAQIKNHIITYLANENITVAAGDIVVNQGFVITVGVVDVEASEITITYTRPVLFPGIARWVPLSATLQGKAVFRNFY
jgi:Flp pilus assembly protein TadG